MSIDGTTRLAVATGFIGAYTTFSTYLYETNTLGDNGAGIKAAVNLIGSIVLGLAAARLGVWVGLRH